MSQHDPFGPMIAQALGPSAQDHLLQARQMQALSFTVHIPLAGRLGDDASGGGGAAEPGDGRAPTLRLPPARAAGLATACLLGGVGFLTFAEAAWAHAIGVTMLLAVIALGVVAAAPGLLDEARP
jgi:hypothetical protein